MFNFICKIDQKAIYLNLLNVDLLYVEKSLRSSPTCLKLYGIEIMNSTPHTKSNKFIPNYVLKCSIPKYKVVCLSQKRKSIL